MKIQHISNSFMIVQTIDAKIVCDPWVGYGNHGGWHSFPEYNLIDLVELVKDCTHVYISHLHSDHLDLDFLKAAELFTKKFIIKDFSTSALKNRLRSINSKDIIEVEEFKKISLTKYTDISIIPQLTSNSSDAEDRINYSLDTSIIFNSEGITFFNQVDNPLSLNDFHIVKKFISANYGELNVACFVCGAASEYPQCFRGIDRATEKNTIIHRSLKKLKETVEVTMPENTFIAGGTYFIPGKLNSLNKYIAQPTTNEIQNAISKITNLIKLEGGASISISENNQIEIIPANIKHQTKDIYQSIQLHETDLYQHQLYSDIDKNEIMEEFEKAKINYYSKIENLKIKIERKIVFKIYENLEIDLNLNILSKLSFSLDLFPIAMEKDYIEIHIDKSAFLGCLTKKLIWNQVLSGSLCIFDRSPNTYEPELLFSINFLTS